MEGIFRIKWLGWMILISFYLPCGRIFYHKMNISFLRGMNDFRQIKYNGHRLMLEDFNVEHEKCLASIRKFAPSLLKHIHPSFKP